MIEDFYKIAPIRMDIKQVMQLNIGTVIKLKNHCVKFTKRCIKTHLGIYCICIVQDELLNKHHMIKNDIRFQITDIRQMKLDKNMLYIDIYGKIL